MENNSPTMKTIIIGFTPYHSHVAARLIEEIDGQFYCAFTKIWPKTTKAYSKIGGVQKNLQGSWFIILMICHFFILLNWWRWTKQPFKAFIPHPSQLLANAVFFLPENTRSIYLYEDGLLNYHDAPTPPISVRRRAQWVARLFGFRYQHYTGHLSGCDIRTYDGAYLSRPEHAVRRHRLGVLHLLRHPPVTTTCKPFTVLFLDQDTSGVMTKEQRDDCIHRMFNQYPLDQYEYHYKPHHDHASALSQIMRRLPPDQERLSAEALLHTWRPSHVASFFSSALMNIKNSQPDMVCIAIAADHVTLSQDGSKRKLTSIFEELQIECI